MALKNKMNILTVCQSTPNPVLKFSVVTSGIFLTVFGTSSYFKKSS